MIPHTEKCEKSEVASVKEGHYVERMTAQSDETADILEQSKDEMSAYLTALEKEGVGSEDQ